jgi:CDP-2,3-bis-(O-geranylgeranyl)-sn-glycerol synthase
MINLELLLLIIIANGVPILAFDLLRQRFSIPLDIGICLPDGERLFGVSKTLRGLLLSLLITGIAAELVGLSLMLGLTVALWSMLGDLLSSFIKRRLRMSPGSQAPGIDQVPESLFPLLAVAGQFSLSGEEIMATVITFIVLELLISRVLFRLHLRKQPH